MEKSRQQDSWHLDKRIPIALILAVIAQTVAVAMWAASIDAEVNNQREQIQALINQDKSQKEELRRVSELLVRLDERLTVQASILRELRDNSRQRNP